MSERIEFQAEGGGAASGEIELPVGAARGPAVVLFHEWWGLNDHVRSLLRRLGEAGFVALAVDLFDGETTKDPAVAGKLMGALDWGVAMQRTWGAVQYLASHPRSNGHVGAIGFCMGGALTLAAACAIPELGAAVPFYGVPAKADWAAAKAPIQAHFATRDQWAKASIAEEVQREVRAGGGSMELFVYDADHAFVNDTRPEVHHPENAKLAWSRATAFLQEKLAT